jgi:hypothetical protein
MYKTRTNTTGGNKASHEVESYKIGGFVDRDPNDKYGYDLAKLIVVITKFLVSLICSVFNLCAGSYIS